MVVGFFYPPQKQAQEWDITLALLGLSKNHCSILAYPHAVSLGWTALIMIEHLRN